MSLRGNPVTLPATLPDGWTITIRVGVLDDPAGAIEPLETTVPST